MCEHRYLALLVLILHADGVQVGDSAMKLLASREWCLYELPVLGRCEIAPGHSFIHFRRKAWRGPRVRPPESRKEHPRRAKLAGRLSSIPTLAALCTLQEVFSSERFNLRGFSHIWTLIQVTYVDIL